MVSKTPYNILTKSDRPLQKLKKKLYSYLPKKYRNHKGITKLIFVLALYEYKKFRVGSELFIGAPISHEELKNSYSGIYNIKDNVIDPTSDISVLAMLVNDGIIHRSSSYNKDNRKPYHYSLNPEIFPDIFIFETHKLYLENSYRMYTKLLADIDIKGCDLLTEVTEVIKSPDKYLCIEESTRLEPHTLDTLKYGRIGSNYIAADLIPEFIKSQINHINSIIANIHTNQQQDQGIQEEREAGAIPPVEVRESPSLLWRWYSPRSPVSDPVVDVLCDGVNGSKFKIMTISESTKYALSSGHVLHHEAPLKVTYTGRFFEYGNLGTTSLNKVLKNYNIEQLKLITGCNIINYDIRACQLSCIVSYGHAYGIEFNHIEEYVNNKNIRKQIADLIGISESLYKKLLLIQTFGGDTTNEYNYTLIDLFSESGITEKSEIRKYIKKYVTYSKGILTDIKKWQEYLRSYKESDRTHLISKCRTLDGRISNQVVSIPYERLSNIKHLSAFLLQGMEASYVLTLIRLSKGCEKVYDYGFLSYEFDGLMSIGEIPEIAMKRAREISGFTTAILEPKSIL